MFGRYAATAFEVEAERRREVIAETMRDIRRSSRMKDEEHRERPRSAAPARHGLEWLAAILFGRVGQRA
jgi:hypothetical protein